MDKAVSGLNTIKDSLRIAGTVGVRNFMRSIISKNTCKTCALGMGGQQGGMKNEVGKFPEICKKSIQAQLTDIQDPIPPGLFENNSILDLQGIRPRELALSGRLNTPLFFSNSSDRYIPIKWDLTDIIKIMENSFNNYDLLRSIAVNAQEKYKKYILGKNASELFVKHFIKLI